MLNVLFLNLIINFNLYILLTLLINIKHPINIISFKIIILVIVKIVIKFNLYSYLLNLQVIAINFNSLFMLEI